MTVAEVAASMRVSKMTVYRMVHNGDLAAVRVGRSFRVPDVPWTTTCQRLHRGRLNHRPDPVPPSRSTPIWSARADPPPGTLGTSREGCVDRSHPEPISSCARHRRR